MELMLLMGFLSEMCLSEGREERGSVPAVLSQSRSATYRRVSAEPLPLESCCHTGGTNGGLLWLDSGPSAGNCCSE